MSSHLPTNPQRVVLAAEICFWSLRIATCALHSLKMIETRDMPWKVYKKFPSCMDHGLEWGPSWLVAWNVWDKFPHFVRGSLWRAKEQSGTYDQSFVWRFTSKALVGPTGGPRLCLVFAVYVVLGEIMWIFLSVSFQHREKKQEKHIPLKPP